MEVCAPRVAVRRETALSVRASRAPRRGRQFFQDDRDPDAVASQHTPDLHARGIDGGQYPCGVVNGLRR